ncbi:MULTISPECIES: urease subunit beta [Streptomyces]|uniref:urease subunit beta n=1 Tax=Streptomyces TaxID=1883 RepID=UPI000D521EFE|nr:MULTISPECIES: urease subunit beta [Streptomyces]NYS17654.1 urease subunit beta [Streptomyces sp. SJ1-7]PVC79080.1 urease subunit beta [Streptomyces sp. CS065A]
MTFRQKYLYGEEPIEINAGRRTVRLTVENTGDRAIQIGSHYHFFEVNSALSFDRQRALGMHLNIPAGTSVRVEPGGTREVELCEYAGTGRLVGFSGLLNGSLVSHPAKVEAVRKAIERGFAGAQNSTQDQKTPEPEKPDEKEPEPRKPDRKKSEPKKPDQKRSQQKKPKSSQKKGSR